MYIHLWGIFPDKIEHWSSFFIISFESKVSNKHIFAFVWKIGFVGIAVFIKTGQVEHWLSLWICLWWCNSLKAKLANLNSQCEHRSYGLVSHLSKMICKLLQVYEYETPSKSSKLRRDRRTTAEFVFYYSNTLQLKKKNCKNDLDYCLNFCERGDHKRLRVLWQV